jgi:hypothetical protein
VQRGAAAVRYAKNSFEQKKFCRFAKLTKIGVRSGKMAACGRPERASNSEQGKKVPVRAIFCKSMFAFLRE